MIVYGVCRSCHNHLSLDAVASTRKELSKKVGDTVNKNCERCGVSNTFETNQLKAKLPKRIRHAILEVTIVGAMLLLTSYLLLDSLKYIALALFLYTIPAIFYVLYTRKNFEVIQTFNKSKV